MSNALINLPDGVDKYSNEQKIVAAGIVSVGLVGLYFILPPLVLILQYLWIAVILALPLVWAVFNPHVVWGFAKTISWNLTKGIIGLDTLSALERYCEWVAAEIAEIKLTAQELSASLLGANQQIAEQEKSYKYNLQAADRHERDGNQVQYQLSLNKAMIDKQALESLVPLRDKSAESLQYINEVDETLSAKKEEFQYTLHSKRREFEILQKTEKGLSKAFRILNKDSSANKIKEESLKQLAEQMNRFTANIESYKTSIKPALDQNKFDKTLRLEEGQQLLAEFRATNFKL